MFKIRSNGVNLRHWPFVCVFVMVALCNRADHYIFILFYGRPME